MQPKLLMQIRVLLLQAVQPKLLMEMMMLLLQVMQPKLLVEKGTLMLQVVQCNQTYCWRNKQTNKQTIILLASSARATAPGA
jgi:hypothetical protein